MLDFVLNCSVLLKSKWDSVDAEAAVEVAFPAVVVAVVAFPAAEADEEVPVDLEVLAVLKTISI